MLDRVCVGSRLRRNIASSTDCSWPRIWNHTLVKGAFGTTCSLAILRLFSLHMFSDYNCPFSGCSQTVTNSEIVAHFLSSHTALNFTAEQCVESLESRSESIFNYIWQRSKSSFLNSNLELIHLFSCCLLLNLISVFLLCFLLHPA